MDYNKVIQMINRLAGSIGHVFDDKNSKLLTDGSKDE
jgi:hypothetical protein